jgi:hypothetical protein
MEHPRPEQEETKDPIDRLVKHALEVGDMPETIKVTVTDGTLETRRFGGTVTHIVRTHNHALQTKIAFFPSEGETPSAKAAYYAALAERRSEQH